MCLLLVFVYADVFAACGKQINMKLRAATCMSPENIRAFPDWYSGRTWRHARQPRTPLRTSHVERRQWRCRDHWTWAAYLEVLYLTYLKALHLKVTYDIDFQSSFQTRPEQPITTRPHFPQLSCPFCLLLSLSISGPRRRVGC